MPKQWSLSHFDLRYSLLYMSDWIHRHVLWDSHKLLRLVSVPERCHLFELCDWFLVLLSVQFRGSSMWAKDQLLPELSVSQQCYMRWSIFRISMCLFRWLFGRYLSDSAYGTMLESSVPLRHLCYFCNWLVLNWRIYVYCTCIKCLHKSLS